MVDAPSLKDWKIKYEEWTGMAVPLFKEGKAKDAMAQYPGLQRKESHLPS